MKLTPERLYLISGVLFLWYLKRQAAALGADVRGAINPVSKDNIFYKGTNAIGESLTGEEGFSLGSWIYDKTH